MTKKRVRLNGGNDIGRSVERSLDEYFRKLEGEPARDVYAMVIGHVERTLLTAMMQRAEQNQTLAADMLGMNRNTLRAKLARRTTL